MICKPNIVAKIRWPRMALILVRDCCNREWVIMTSSITSV
jgi:hypothetical protein